MNIGPDLLLELHISEQTTQVSGTLPCGYLQSMNYLYI